MHISLPAAYEGKSLGGLSRQRWGGGRAARGVRTRAKHLGESLRRLVQYIKHGEHLRSGPLLCQNRRSPHLVRSEIRCKPCQGWLIFTDSNSRSTGKFLGAENPMPIFPSGKSYFILMVSIGVSLTVRESSLPLHVAVYIFFAFPERIFFEPAVPPCSTSPSGPNTKIE